MRMYHRAVPGRPLVALLLAGDLACGTPTPACPTGTARDDERAQAVRDVARGVRGGPVGDAEVICFGGDDRGSLLPDGVVLLSDALDVRAAAARLIHLQHHAADGLHRFPAIGVACDRQMAHVIAAEARAIAAEIAACDELGCAAPPYSFAAVVLAAAPDERAARVEARLRDGPATDGLDVQLHRYQARCDEAQGPRPRF